MLTVFWNRQNFGVSFGRPHMQRRCNGFPISLIQSALTMSARLKNKVNIFSVKNLAVPFLKSFKGYWGNCEFYNFFVCQKEKFTRRCSYSVLRVLQIAKSNSRPMCGLDMQNLKDEDLAVMPSVHQNHLFYIRCIDNCKETVLKIRQVPQFSFVRILKDQSSGTCFILYFDIFWLCKICE